MKRLRSERGVALLEAAVTLPLLLVVSIGIFEFGRAFQTWQVLTNAAREGARVAVLPDPTPGIVEQRVRDYMEAGRLSGYDAAKVNVDRSESMTVGTANVSASRVTVDYPFSFVVLQPILRLVTRESTFPNAVTMRAEALMRNETQSVMP